MNIATETLKYAINYMIAKMRDAGATEAETAAYLTSDAGITKAYELAAEFYGAYLRSQPAAANG